MEAHQGVLIHDANDRELRNAISEMCGGNRFRTSNESSRMRPHSGRRESMIRARECQSKLKDDWERCRTATVRGLVVNAGARAHKAAEFDELPV